jgi:PAP2 superfamily
MSKRKYVLIPGFCCALVTASLPARANDPVSEWNQTALARTLGAVPAQAPVVQTRTMAIVQVSVHDAINAITGEYDTYTSHGPVPANASAAAAAISAAHYALRGLFPDHAAALDIQYVDSLVAHGVSANDPGLTFGRSVAARILSLRANDKAADAQFDYTVPGAGAPGVWVRLNNAPALLPGWGTVTPWVMKSGAQFRPDAPPALTSERYAKDYNEVKEIGSNTTVGEPMEIALFWRASPAAIWNGVLTQVLAGRNLGLAAKARAFALMYLAAADSSIACWEAKYHYNFWRPFPAIVNGELDGNPATIGDEEWLPLLPTPAHPEYPSGHTTNSNAMVTVLRVLFGDDPGVPLELTFTGITRRWTTFQEGIDEVIDARVYSGIHCRNSDVVGARLGRQVAHFVMTHALRPPTGSWKK